jgi:hypothetical protein
MKEFIRQEGLNKKGIDMLDAYQVYINPMTPNLVRESIKEYMLKEKAVKVTEAVKKSATLPEFEDILKSYSCYMKGNADFCGDAHEYIQEYMEQNCKTPYTTMKNNYYITVQYRIGLKSTEVETLFDVSSGKANQMFSDGFVKTFVDTYMRKKANEVIAKYKERLDKCAVVVKMSDAYKVQGRKMYDIDLDFRIAPKSLTAEACQVIVEVLAELAEYVVVK